MTHNLQWRDVRVLFSSLGEIEEEPNGSLKVTIAGHTAVFQSASKKDAATAEQVIQIRHILQDAKERSPGITGPHLLVVIDHKQARIYRTELKGTVPETVKPEDNLGHKGHVHSAHDYSDHIEKPNQEAYFEAVCKSLETAEKVLIFGSGKGSSNTMDQFTLWLRAHHPKVADCIFMSVVVDESHLTEGALLAKARDIYGGGLAGSAK